MATIKMRCTKCRQKLSLAEKFVGTKIKCPKCKTRLRITQGTATAPPAALNSTANATTEAPTSEVLATQNAQLKQQAAALKEHVTQLEERLATANEKIRKSLAMPKIPSSPSSANGVVRQNAALQRRVDALNMELDEKARVLSAAERRNRELEDEIQFLKETGHLQEKARNSINSFIQNVERNESPGLSRTSRKH